MPHIKTNLIRIATKRQLQSYAGVNQAELSAILPVFSSILDEIDAICYHASAHLRQRKKGGGRRYFLENALEKLLFTLHYLKTYPLFDNLGTEFKVSATTANKAVHYFVPVLHLALVRLKVMPQRQFDSPQALLDTLKDLGGIEQIIIDATERAHRRCCKKELRNPLYSGKKKRFTIKNTIITTLTRWIVFVGLTTQGSMHDFELLKEELKWYEGQDKWFELLEVFVDLGYLGFETDFKAGKLHIPIKKPKKSKEKPDTKLSDEQKEHNKQVAKTRVRVEHAIGDMKIFHVMVHAYRNFKQDFDDVTIAITAALTNLKIKTAQSY